MTQPSGGGNAAPLPPRQQQQYAAPSDPFATPKKLPKRETKFLKAVPTQALEAEKSGDQDMADNMRFMAGSLLKGNQVAKNLFAMAAETPPTGDTREFVGKMAFDGSCY